MKCTNCLKEIDDETAVLAEFALIYHKHQSIEICPKEFSGDIRHINCDTYLPLLQNDPKGDSK